MFLQFAIWAFLKFTDGGECWVDLNEVLLTIEHNNIKVGECKLCMRQNKKSCCGRTGDRYHD